MAATASNSNEKIVLRVHTEASPALQAVQLGGIFRTLVCNRSDTSKTVVDIFLGSLARVLSDGKLPPSVAEEVSTLYVFSKEWNAMIFSLSLLLFFSKIFGQ